MDHPIEDRVGECWDPDHIVPAVDRDLTGDHNRAGIVAILDDFEKIARLIRGERLRSPIVEYEQFGARDRAQELGVTPVTMRDRQIGEQPRHAIVEDGHILSAGFLAERAGEPTLSQTCGAGDQQIAAFGDPVAGGEFEEQSAVEPARVLVIDIFDGGGYDAGAQPWRAFRTVFAGAASVHIRAAGQAIRRDRGRAPLLCVRVPYPGGMIALTRLHQLNAIFAIFGASDRDKSLDLKGRGLRNRL